MQCQAIIAVALVTVPTLASARPHHPRRAPAGAWVLFGLQRGAAVPLACQRRDGKLLTRAACLGIAPAGARLRVLGGRRRLAIVGPKTLQCRRGADHSPRAMLTLRGAKGIAAGLALWPASRGPRWQRRGTVRWKAKGGASPGSVGLGAWSAFLDQVRRDSKALGGRPLVRIHQADRVDLGGDGRAELLVSVTRAGKGFYSALYLLHGAAPAQRIAFAHDDTMRRLLLATLSAPRQSRPLLVFYAPYYDWPAYTLERLERTGRLRRLAHITSCP